MRIDYEYLKQNPDQELIMPLNWKSDPIEIGGQTVHWSAPLSGELRFQALDQNIQMQGELEGTLKVACVRCLKDFDFPVKSQFTVEISPPGTAEDTGDIYLIEGNEIDLEPILMEQILFNLPINLVCSEECRGLCPQCGQDLNLKDCQCETKQTDPRWDALKKLMEGKEG